MDPATSVSPARTKNVLRGLMRDMTWFSALLWALMALVGVLVVYPLLTALVHEFDQVLIGLGELTQGDLAGSVPTVLWNTFVVVVGGTAIALVIGSALAWANERSDASLGWIGHMLPLAALIVPPIAGVIGWAVLLDPRAGLMNHWIRNLLAPLGIRFDIGPFNIYTMAGLVIITGLYIVPYVYLVVSAALQRLDPSVEEASRVSGANPFRTLYRVTLPAVRPALVASGLLGVISGVSLFSVPAILGGGARIDVLSVFIYRLLSVYPTRIGPALVLAMGMLVLVQVLLVAQHLLIKRGQSAAIGGRGFRGTRVKLGPFRYLVLSLAGVYLLATSVLPLAGLLLVSLQPFWTPSINWSTLTLDNFRFVLFENRTTVNALINSMWLGCVVASLNMLLTGATTLHFVRNPAARRLADSLTGMPATIPHTVIGVAFILAFSQQPLRLYGTTAILLLAYIVMTLPYAARAASAAADTIGIELGEASRINKASDLVTLWRIMLPLALPGLVAGWIMVFVHTVGEITASAFLSGANNPVIGRVLLDFWTFGNFPQVASLALIITLISSSFVGLMVFVTRRRHAATVS